MNWYIGQEIVAIRNHPQRYFKKGNTFKIVGLQQGVCGCAGVDINIGFGGNTWKMQYCNKCGQTYDTNSTIIWFGEKNFAPLDQDISELTEILEQPISTTCQ